MFEAQGVAAPALSLPGGDRPAYLNDFVFGHDD
jgi:hypothetical protein